MIVDIRPAGDRSLLLNFGSLEDAMACRQFLASSQLSGQLDAIVGARTVLVRFASRRHAAHARQVLPEMSFCTASTGRPATVQIDVAYIGDDLEEIASALSVSIDALIEWHSAQEWFGAFAGIAGFTYCAPKEQLHPIPRKDAPRVAVPAGSVALGSEFSAVYPRTAPGGWQIIGRTDAVMWDLRREDPALIRPGDTVRFQPVRAASVGRTLGAVPEPDETTTALNDEAVGHKEPKLDILNAGMQTLIEDRGREGKSEFGVPLSGVADRAAAYQANALVGNAYDAAVLEVLYGQLSVRAAVNVVLAVCGAEVELAIFSEEDHRRSAAMHEPFVLLAGEALNMGTPTAGVRSVVALRGGVAATAVFGSSSTDTHAGLGPPPLKSGDQISSASSDIAAVSAHPAATTLPDSLLAPKRSRERTVRLRFVYGPRHEWFGDSDLQRLRSQRWIVTSESNRIGIRLGLDPGNPLARPLQRSRAGELLSEGMALGSLQVPPSGEPILLLQDQAVTGGYPIIGVLLEEDLRHAAQLAPGTFIRLIPVDPGTFTPIEPYGGRET